MATGQRILDRLKQAKARQQEEEILDHLGPRPGVLPLAAFYGREPEQEELRTRMYEAVARVMAMREIEGGRPGRAAHGHYLILDMKDAYAIIDASSSPIEFLVSRGEMEFETDEDGMSGVRFHTALRFRDLINGSQVKGIKSPSLEGGGGGSVSPADIRGYQLDCMNLIGKIRKAMPEAWLFPMLEAVVFMDEWLDLWPAEESRADKRETKRKQRLKTLQALHYALDRAGATLGYMAEEDFMRRWPNGAPAVPPSVRRRSQASRVSNQLALLTSPGARRA